MPKMSEFTPSTVATGATLVPQVRGGVNEIITLDNLLTGRTFGGTTTMATAVVTASLTAPIFDKGGEKFDVTSYGSSTIDGTTDNSDRFIAASAAAVAVGGGTIYAPRSYGLGAQVTLGANVHLVGAGMGATIIKRGAAFSGVQIVPGTNSVIRDLTMDGNFGVAPNHVSQEISASALNARIERVHIKNPNYIGIAVGDFAGVKILNCILTGNSNATTGAYGIWAASTGVTGLEMAHNTMTAWTLGAVYMGGTGIRFVHNHLSGNHVQTSPSGGGQIAAGVDGSFTVSGNYVGPGGGSVTSGIEANVNGTWTITDNDIIGQPRFGIVIQGSANHIISSNRVRNSGFSGIIVAAGVSGFQLIGNRCYDTQGSPTQDWGIEIEVGASDNYVILGNRLSGNVSGGLSDGGSGGTKYVAGNL